MSTERYNCPLCKKNKAHRAYAYPQMVVCRCDDGIIKDVGSIQNKQFVASTNIQINTQRTPVGNTLCAGNFHVSKLTSDKAVEEQGLLFNNALQMKDSRKMFMSRGDIWVALYKNEQNNDRSMIFLVTKGKEFTNCYGRNNTSIPQEDKDIVKNLLKNHNIIEG